MLKDRGELENKLTKWIAQNTVHKTGVSTTQQKCLEIYEKYNIPIGITSDILSQRKDFSEYNEFILFAITDVILPNQIKEFYTPQEIKLYSKEKFKPTKTLLPLKLHVIKIAEDQYIGKITAKFLMGLREQQLINYNADTQRALRIMLRGGTKVLRPYIDDKAVTEIESSFEQKTFIPNVITLNINLDDENAEYVYDEQEEILKISNLSAFDIVDGYHRYLGMSRNYDKDNNWDYVMILQVTMFSVGKAKQFIWQEDHKTKMKRVDASTYDQYNAGNIITNRLNTDPGCNLNNNIGVTQGVVNAGVFSKAINRVYFTKKPDRKRIIEITKELKEKINVFTESYSEYLEKEWATYEILTIIYGFSIDSKPDVIYKAIHSFNKDEQKTLDKIKDLNNKALKMIREVY